MSYFSTLSLQPVFYNGELVIGAKIFVYDAGTNTARAAYTNEALTVPHTAPFLTDANGVIPPFWVTSGAAIKVVIKNPDDTVIRTIDGIPTLSFDSPLPVASGGTGVTTSTGTGSVVLNTSPTFTTSALFPAGTVSAPGISVSGDTNTGIYFPAADTIGFVEGGVEAMRLDASGNLGIGTTAPSYKLHVSGTSVGGFVSSYLTNTNTTSGSAAASYIVNGTVTGVTYASQSVGGLVSGTVTSNPWLLITNNAERMRIDASGNVGIGTTSPGNYGKFAVYAASGYMASAFVSGTADYRLFVNSSGEGGFQSVTSGNPLIFMTNGGGGTTERARVTSSGKLLVGGTTDNGTYNIQCNGTGVWGAGAYVNGSDERIKDNIQDIASCVDVIMSLRPVTFQYKPGFSKDTSVQPGFIAQDLQQALAGQAYGSGVVTEGPQYLSVAYQALIPVLTKATQELAVELTEAKARIAALEAKQ